MKTIWKFKLEVKDSQKVEMPKGAKLLYVGVQDNIPHLWAEVDPDNINGKATIVTFGTGQRVDADRLGFVGTYMLYGGSFVGHVYGKAP